MRIDNEAAYVMHRRAFGESSVILELFTQNHGRIGAMARGARQFKPKSGKDALSVGALYAVDLAGQGELLQLRRFEIMRTAPPLSGERALAMLYVNELLVALLPRGDCHEALFVSYKNLIEALPMADLASQLRAFERSVLDDLGYGIDFAQDADGQAIAPEQHYRVDVNVGFHLSQAGALGVFSGAAILEFEHGEFSRPNAHATRLLMRNLIGERLHGRSLTSWTLMRDLQALKA
jgi:DNA repair protein RecO (recombination protein O)